ncbi:MAG TPA: head-tail connector protein [Candidatus Dojkabacteria bacterium]|nr:head-tail connector protein [Candidatus Dojkabacteria bacterium]
MEIKLDDFKAYLGTSEDDDTLPNIFLNSAKNIVEEYLNDDLETTYADDIPGIIILTIYRIGALLSSESNGNIGITSKSFSDGSRTFIKTTDYEPYLLQIARYIKVV